MSLATLDAITLEQVGMWAVASRSQKTMILDSVCRSTGWHRDHARKVIRTMARATHLGNSAQEPRERVRIYDDQVVDLLTHCWLLLDKPTGKRLHPALPALVANLRRHGRIDWVEPHVIDLLLQMSPATIDRRLAPARAQLGGPRAHARTRPGSTLKSFVPVRSWTPWDDSFPGFLLIDLIHHSSGDGAQEHHMSITGTDIATGWSETTTVSNAAHVPDAMDTLRYRFPFPIAGIHSDNSEPDFNRQLHHWVNEHRISFRCSDAGYFATQAQTQEKSWSFVRHHVGSRHFASVEELQLLNQLWPLVSALSNLFVPQQRRTEPDQQGNQRRRRYDTAASPLQRVLGQFGDFLHEPQRQRLEQWRASTDLEALKREISGIQLSLTNPPQLRLPDRNSLVYPVGLYGRKLDDSHLGSVRGSLRAAVPCARASANQTVQASHRALLRQLG